MKKKAEITFDLPEGIQKIAKRLEYYRENPNMIKLNLKMYYHTLKYNLLNEFDPPPPCNKGEALNEYYERIDPKYGLRYYEMLLTHCLRFDLEYALPQVDKTFGDKKSRDIFKKLLIISNENEQKCQECYRKYLIRSEVLKKF